MANDAQLREAVARALCTADEQPGGPPWDYVLTMGEPFVKYYYDRADAAIALMRPVIRAETLEEAARVAEESVVQECCGNFDGDYGSLLECCGKPNVTPMYPDEIAAAIRALIPSGVEPSQKDG